MKQFLQNNIGRIAASLFVTALVTGVALFAQVQFSGEKNIGGSISIPISTGEPGDFTYEHMRIMSVISDSDEFVQSYPFLNENALVDYFVTTTGIYNTLVAASTTAVYGDPGYSATQFGQNLDFFYDFDSDTQNVQDSGLALQAGSNTTTVVITNTDVRSGDWVYNATRSAWTQVASGGGGTYTVSPAVTGQVPGDTLRIYDLHEDIGNATYTTIGQTGAVQTATSTFGLYGVVSSTLTTDGILRSGFAFNTESVSTNQFIYITVGDTLFINMITASGTLAIATFNESFEVVLTGVELDIEANTDYLAYIDFDPSEGNELSMVLHGPSGTSIATGTYAFDFNAGLNEVFIGGIDGGGGTTAVPFTGKLGNLAFFTGDPEPAGVDRLDFIESVYNDGNIRPWNYKRKDVIVAISSDETYSREIPSSVNSTRFAPVVLGDYDDLEVALINGSGTVLTPIRVNGETRYSMQNISEPLYVRMRIYNDTILQAYYMLIKE